MKIIKIKSCWDCPYCKSVADLEGFRCIKMEKRRAYQSSFPVWCPLEDAQDTGTEY